MGREYHDFLSNFFLSHSAEIFRRGILQCVTNFGYRNILRFRELCHDFVSTFFCLKVPKNFVEEHFWYVLQKFSGSEKIFVDKRGASRFCWNFLSHRSETNCFVKELFCSQEIFGIEKFMGKTGHITIFGRYSYVSLCQKLQKGVLLFL